MGSVIVSVIALIFSVTSFVWLCCERDRRKRREVTLRLFDFWNSQDMQERRGNVWLHLNALESAGQTEYWQELEGDGTRQALWLDFGAIDHFIADLNVLWDRKMIDERLVCSMFGETLLHYFERFDKLMVYNTRGSKSWFKNNMKPLEAKLKRGPQPNTPGRRTLARWMKCAGCPYK